MSHTTEGGSIAADAGAHHAALADTSGPEASTASEHQTSKQLQKLQEGSKGEDSSTAEEDEQFKYHQQMLYPTPGQRNYGFSEEFMMYRFKVEPCKRQEKHARGSCPFAHPGDVAQRRHPEAYQALLCPEVRAKKVCPRSNDCQCSHSAFEFWLHPDRYRTSLCEKGERCSRPVCFFAHNEKELRQLPAGLKPALQTPEETAKRQIGHRAGGMPMSAVHSPTSSAGFSVPALARDGAQYVYLQNIGPPVASRQLMQPAPPMAMVAPGYTAEGYRGAAVAPAVDGSMQSQYPGMIAPQYLPQPQLLPTGVLPAAAPGTGAVLLGGGTPVAAAAGANQQFSPVAAVTSRASQSSGGNSSVGGMWQQQQTQQVQQPGPPAHARQVLTAPGSSAQFPVEVLQQFQQFGVGAPAVAAHPSYDPATGVLLHPMHAYGHQQQVMYAPSVAQQGWGQQPLPNQQQQQPQVQYGLGQYAPSPLDTQRASQAVGEQQVAAGSLMGRVIGGGAMGAAGLAASQQQPGAAGGVFPAVQGDVQATPALGQAWPAGGVVLGPQHMGATALVGPVMGMAGRPAVPNAPQSPAFDSQSW